MAEDKRQNNLTSIASFVIKVIIMFTTVIALFYFAERYNQLLFTFLIILFLVAIITEGIGKLLNSSK